MEDSCRPYRDGPERGGPGLTLGTGSGEGRDADVGVFSFGLCRNPPSID